MARRKAAKKPKPPPKPREVSWHAQNYAAEKGPAEKSAYQPAREVSPTTGLMEYSGVEGQLSIGHALSAWHRERDRIANRAWRRPGWLAWMATTTTTTIVMFSMPIGIETC